MPNAKEIKTRMNSVRETQKITNAMYLISSTKLRKAKAELDSTRPYYVALRDEIKRIFRTVYDVESKYVYPPGNEPETNGAYACLVFTADKGLAGAYNMNVIKEAEKLLSEHEDTLLFVIGEYGRRYFESHHIPIERSFLYTAQNPTMRRAREISGILLDLFDQGKVDKIFLIYTDMQNSMNAQAISTRLLPFHRQHFEDEEDHSGESDFEFTPSISAVLDNVMHSYVSGFVYSAMVESFCSEQNARMNAMKSANDNADSILADLSVQYNSVRQGAITQEITEISSGAKAQQRKKQRGGV